MAVNECNAILIRGEVVMKTGPSARHELASRKPRRKTSPDLFDGTLQKTQIWLNDLMSDSLGRETGAYLALRTVLHALRDRLPVEAVPPGAQLPMLVRGFTRR
jgi:hypothetical protein